MPDATKDAPPAARSARTVSATRSRGLAARHLLLGLVAGTVLGAGGATIVLEHRAADAARGDEAAVRALMGAGAATPDAAPVSPPAPPPPDGTVRDRDLRPPADWGTDAFAEVLETIDALAGPNASLRRRVIAANLVVSRMDNGAREPVESWSDHLESGLRNGSCGRRADLLGGIVRAWEPDLPLRFCGMASVPKQASHTTLEVWLPDQGGWAWFDPSAGLYFTDGGAPEGRILTQAEVFADPSIVDRVGPWAPAIDRIEGPPRAVRPEGPLDALVTRTPGFALPNFPLRRMLELSTAWGSGDPHDPRPAHVRLHARDLPRVEAARLEEGRVRSVVLRDDERRLTWQDRAGVSANGINVVPVVEIDGLRPGERAHLVVRAIPRHRDVRLRPLAVDGVRIARTRLAADPAATSDQPVVELTVELVATGRRALVALLHGGDDRNERAVVLSWEIRTMRDSERSAG